MNNVFIKPFQAKLFQKKPRHTTINQKVCLLDPDSQHLNNQIVFETVQQWQIEKRKFLL